MEMQELLRLAAESRVTVEFRRPEAGFDWASTFVVRARIKQCDGECMCEIPLDIYDVLEPTADSEVEFANAVLAVLRPVMCFYRQRKLSGASLEGKVDGDGE